MGSESGRSDSCRGGKGDCGKGKGEFGFLPFRNCRRLSLPPSIKIQVLAKVLVQNEGKVVKEVNLLAASDVEKA